MAELACTNSLRSFERVAVRTSAIAYDLVPQTNRVRSVRAWTDDLSPSGAKLVTEKPLSGEPFWLKVMLPELANQVFVCRIARKGRSLVKTLANLEDVERHTYGIEFTGVASPEELVALADATHN